MPLSNEIVLRPRFQLDLEKDKQSILEAFGRKKASTDEVVTSVVDDHIFIRISKINQHFWSPQLHLEVLGKEDGGCTVFGLFGPSPTLWTFFMFVHFAVAILFMGLGIWAYTLASLNEPYAVQIAGMALLALLWIGLYFGGRLGKKAGNGQMMTLHRFMERTLATP
ncbi:MAG: GTP-binding protein [Flavobacteriaceae bacterium]|nr:GTP-binding protein [Flavobacteriaceae bacterium]